MNMNFPKIVLLFIGLFYLSSIVIAQENQGVVFDNYNPVNGQFINPSNIVDAKPWLDINIIGASAFIYNNMFYYPNTTLWNFDAFKSEPLFKENVNKINAYTNTFVLGPSVSLVVEKQSFSLFSAARVVGNVLNAPSVLGKMAATDGTDDNDTGFYDVKNARVKTMAWGEIGFTYGRILKSNGFEMITGAVSVKRLFGFQNSTVNVKEGQLHVVTPDSALLFTDNGKFSYAEPASNAGKGWGISLGATFKKMKNNVDQYYPHSTKSRCNLIDYKYKIGVSLIDLGFINYRSGAIYGDLESVTTLDTIDSGDDVLDEANRLAKGNKFTAPLPAALSVQADYNVNDKIYLNATIIQRIPFIKSFGVERENLLTVSGRYETKYIGVALPISIVNYEKMIVGLAFRLANLTIGTDHLLPWIIKQDVNTASLYFNLKITIFNSPSCRSKNNKVKEKHRINKCATWK
jgi:hypothetical protein